MTDLNNQDSDPAYEDADMEEEAWLESESEETITEPFDPTKIRVETRLMPINLVLSRIQYKELDLAPDFQRYAGIWTDANKSRLIESILIRIPLPAFYMDATDDDKWLVVDGLQRLTALKKFVIDKELRLKGLEYLEDIEGKSYEELPRKYQRRIQETVITVYLIDRGTPPEVKFNIYKRINTGGLPLSLQEIRHALNQKGQAAIFLARLAESAEFKQAADIKDGRKKRMIDREFVLRFISFILTPYQDYKAKRMDFFLNDAMAQIDLMSESELEKLEHKFKQVMIVAYDLFGQDAFRKPNLNQRRSPINKALFEVWSVNIAVLKQEEINIIKTKKTQLAEKLSRLMEDDAKFNSSVSERTSNVSRVKYRFSKIEEIIKEVLRD
ncbi:MAG: DUF262 domain-containing protein [Oscillatoria sp. SIO1A7]|nr:DUF262 domain-containing protein [Oscillatoria sp. SIO1A7]